MARLKAEKPLDELAERIGIAIAERDRARFERALTHASLKPANGASTSYERLEFLGDRVLGLVVAEKLFEMFPKADEGELSLRLNSLVSAETCSEVADEIGLHAYIRHGGDLKKLRGEHTRNIRADVVESLIAAIYLAEGLEAARRFVLRFWSDRLTAAVKARRDPKTALQEWAHSQSKTTPHYEVLDRSGPDHDPVFTVQAVVADVEPAEGRGRSKRLAEQEAAMVILAREGVWKDES
ncbi:ribonuclease III [Mangrovicella endophytica]|uniref:ribonuclease III n=1 Tax=Mangrovicella endophytica TaxID=2066697 RepID=UPI000C9E842A|nr:ribonuclease III [Mangrovicella endophytica]